MTDLSGQLPRTPLPSQDNSRDEPWYGGLLHKLLKVEEVSARTIGKLSSSDPKYNEIFKPSSYHTQTTFAEMLGDVGVDEKNFGSYAPMVAAVAGIGAAIMNPIDPINKLRIFGLTGKGFAGQAIKNAGIKNLVKTGEKAAGRDIMAINRSKIESELAALVKNKKD